MLINKSILGIALGMMFTYAGIETALQYLNCFPTEAIAETKRILFYNYTNVVYGVGMMIDSFAFFALKSWRLVFIFIYIIAAVLCLLATVFIIQKTPIDLVKS